MCCGYGCGSCHEWHHRSFMDFPLLRPVEEEVKMLEELKGALEERLKRVNERLEALKR
jgi:hypothetical protein